MELISKIKKSLFYSLEGLKVAIKEELSFRLELIIFIILLPIIYFISKTRTDFCILLISYFLIFITEMLNSALEALTDRVSSEHHPLSKKVKDLGSGAVFLAIILFSIIFIINII